MNLDWELVWNRFINGGYKTFLTGLQNTMTIAVFGLILGLVVGCVLATVKIIPSKNFGVKILRGIANVYITIFRGTPMLTQLILFHFGINLPFRLGIESLYEAMVIFGLNSGAYMAETIRSGINAIDIGQMEAARCVGLPYGSSMVKIILPQAIKNILPSIGNEFISLVKETSVVFYIAVVDIFVSFDRIAASTYQYLVSYIFLALTYLVIVMIITGLVRLLEMRLKKDERK